MAVSTVRLIYLLPSALLGAWIFLCHTTRHCRFLRCAPRQRFYPHIQEINCKIYYKLVMPRAAGAQSSLVTYSRLWSPGMSWFTSGSSLEKILSIGLSGTLTIVDKSYSWSSHYFLLLLSIFQKTLVEWLWHFTVKMPILALTLFSDGSCPHYKWIFATWAAVCSATQCPTVHKRVQKQAYFNSVTKMGLKISLDLCTF